MTQVESDNWKFDPKKYEGYDKPCIPRLTYYHTATRPYGSIIVKINGKTWGELQNNLTKDDGLIEAMLDAPHLLVELVKEKAENQRLREALQAARRAMNYEWVKYYQWGMSVPTSLKKAINGAVRVLGEEGGEA